MALRSNFNSENGELSSEVLNIFLVLSLCTISFHDTQSSSFSLSFFLLVFLSLCIILLSVYLFYSYPQFCLHIFIRFLTMHIFFFTYLVMPNLLNSLKILFLCLSLYLSISVYQSLSVYVSIDPFVFFNIFLVFSPYQNSSVHLFFSNSLFISLFSFIFLSFSRSVSPFPPPSQSSIFFPFPNLYCSLPNLYFSLFLICIPPFF